jgi:hypothetical protein
LMLARMTSHLSPKKTKKFLILKKKFRILTLKKRLQQIRRK